MPSLDLVLVEEEGVVGVREVLLHVVLCLAHLVRIAPRLLEELLEDVEQLDTVLLLLLVLKEEGVVLEELLFALLLVLECWSLGPCRVHELLWFVIGL